MDASSQPSDKPRSKPSAKSPDQPSARERLKNAAITLIIERGFAGATLTPILNEAGLSKGALFHHFSGRDELMAAAYMQVLSDHMAHERVQARRLLAREITLEDLLTDMVAHAFSDSYIVTLELAVAVRTHPAILDAADGFKDWTEFREHFWSNLFDLPGHDADAAAAHWEMVNFTMRGIGVRHSFGTEKRAPRALARALITEYFRNATLRAEDDAKPL